MELGNVVLRARSPTQLARFYTGILGMSERTCGDGIHLSYNGKDSALVLMPAALERAYNLTADDRYWKIGITLPNIDLAYRQLRSAGVDVSEPRQFMDIGYMCHLHDPEGFAIELLQHTFEGNRPQGAGDPNAPLGGGARIGQITLRTTDMESELEFYRDRLGMQLLSIQPVTGRDFTLYFLAFTNETPPCSDLQAIENREWLWQRPYTTLEFQHLLTPDASVELPRHGKPGLAQIGLSGSTSSETVLEDAAGGTVALTP